MNPDPDFKISATPYLCVHDAAAALDFYAKAFGAVETLRMAEPSGKIGHAEFHIGAAQFMLASEFPEIGVLSPKTLGGSPVLIVLDLPDVDAFAATATAAPGRNDDMQTRPGENRAPAAALPPRS